MCLSAVACSGLSEADSKRINEVLGDSLFSTSLSWQINMDIIEDGSRKLNLKSTTAKSYTIDKNKYTALSGPVEISIFKNDTLDTEVFSDSAVYKPTDSVFELYGNVKVFTTAGRRLRSDYLKWERTKDLVSTNLEITIITQTDSIDAKGFIGNSDLTDYTLNEVTGQTVIN